MVRKCPNCKSVNVRRSSRRGKDGTESRLFRSPYRCRDCGQKFWVLGRRVYRRLGLTLGLATAFSVFVTFLTGVFLLVEWFE